MNDLYALCMIFAAGSLLTLLCVAIYEWWRDKRDAQTDEMMRKGMAEAYKRGLIGREKNMNRGYTLIELLVVIVWLSFVICIGWVICHFVAKFW